MPFPLKISVKGSSLTCAEYDENLDRLLDRANHTGTQSCSTLSDLSDCVGDLTLITDIQDDLADLVQRLNELEASLASDGAVDDRINAVRDELIQLINLTNADLLALTIRVTTAEGDILGLEAGLAALSALVNQINITLTNTDTLLSNRLTAVENVNNTQNSNIATNATAINTETTQRTAAISNLQTQITNEVSARTTADNILTAAINAESSARSAAITSEQNTRNAAINTLTNDLNAESANRQAVDNNLQAQINNLQNQLNSINGIISGIASVPVGTIIAHHRANDPLNGYLRCLGQAVPRSQFINLFNVIGTTYGAGDGFSTFNLPNLDNRVLFGTSIQNSGVTGGAFSYAIGVHHLPPHQHSMPQVLHNHGITTGGHSHGVGDPGHAHGIPQSGHRHYIAELIEDGDTGGVPGIDIGDEGNLRNVLNHRPWTSYENAGIGGTSGSGTGVFIHGVGNLGGHTDTRQAHPDWTHHTGSGAAFDVMNPHMRMMFWIKF